MALSDRYWTRVFRNEFVPQISAIVHALEKRLLPGFEEIEEEAKNVSEEAWERFMSMPSTGDEDPADFAEAAEQAGVSYYLLMDGVRQGMLNLFAAALSHAFEQQILLFHRKQVLHPAEENDPKHFSISVFQARLRDFGIEIEKFEYWPKVQELRLVANTVKHAEGKAARQLLMVRPDMFEHPRIATQFSRLADPHVFQPLVGEDLFVSLKDIKDYHGQLVRFWEELADAIQLASGYEQG